MNRKIKHNLPILGENKTGCCAENNLFPRMETKKSPYLFQGSHAVLKVLNFKISFQDLEKVLNFANMYIRQGFF